jgi:hypothetical protein
MQPLKDLGMLAMQISPGQPGNACNADPLQDSLVVKAR